MCDLRRSEFRRLVSFLRFHRGNPVDSFVEVELQVNASVFRKHKRRGKKKRRGNANAGNEIPLDVLVLYAY